MSVRHAIAAPARRGRRSPAPQRLGRAKIIAIGASFVVQVALGAYVMTQMPGQ